MAGRGSDGIGSIFISFAIRHGKCHCGMCHVFVWKIRSWEIVEIFIIGIYDRIVNNRLLLVEKDSADGRLLIWRCGLEMVKDAPWTGHGVGSFEAKYMDYQADYFKEYGSQNRYAMLADNVKQPFNEYLGVLINFGIVGLALLLGIVGHLCIVIGKILHRKRK